MTNTSRVIENIEAFLRELEAGSPLSDGNKRRAAIGLAFQPMREAVAKYLDNIIVYMQLEVARRAEQGEKAQDIWRYILEETRAFGAEKRSQRGVLGCLSDQWSSKLRNYAAEVKNKLGLSDDVEAMKKVLSFPIVNQEMLDMFVCTYTKYGAVDISEKPVPECGVDRRPQWKYINGNDTKNVGCSTCGFVFERPSDNDREAKHDKWPRYMFKVGAFVTEVGQDEPLEITDVLDAHLPWKTRYAIPNRGKKVYGRFLQPHATCDIDKYEELPTTSRCNHGSKKNGGVWSPECAYDTAVNDLPFDLYRLFGPDADLGKAEARERWISGELPANETALLHIVAGLTPDPLIRRVADAIRLRVRNIWGHSEPDDAQHRVGIHLMATFVEMIGGDDSEVLRWLDVTDVSKALGNAQVIETLKESLCWLQIMLPSEVMERRVDDLEDRVERHDRRLHAVEEQVPLGKTPRPKQAKWFREDDHNITGMIKYLKECVEKRVDSVIVVCMYGMPGCGKSESLGHIVPRLRQLGFNDVIIDCEHVSSAVLQKSLSQNSLPLLVMDDVPSFDKLLDAVCMAQSKPLFVLAASRSKLFEQADIDRSAAIDEGYHIQLDDVIHSVAIQYVTDSLPWLDRLVVDRVVDLSDGHSMCLEVIVAWFARFESDADRVLRELDRMERDHSAETDKRKHVFDLMATAIAALDVNTRKVLAAATMFPKYFTCRNIMTLLDVSDEDSVNDSLYELTCRSLVTFIGIPWYTAPHGLIRDQFDDPDLKGQFVRFEASLLCFAWQSRYLPVWQLSDHDRALLDYDDDQLNGITAIVNETPRTSASGPVSQGMTTFAAAGMPSIVCATSDLVKEIRRVAIRPRHGLRYIVGYAAVDLQVELGNVNQMIRFLSQGTSFVRHYCWLDLVDSSSKDVISELCDAQPYDESFVSCLIHVVGGYLSDDADCIRECIDWFRGHYYKQLLVYAIAKLSLCHHNLGQDDEAAVALLEAKDIYQASDTHISAVALVEAATACGKLYCYRNRYEEARVWLEFGQDIAESSLYHSSHAVKALNDAFFSLYSCMERPEALESFKDLVRRYDATTSADMESVVRMYFLLGHNVVKSHDSELVDTLLFIVRHFWNKTNDFDCEDVLCSVNNLAIALCELGKYFESRCLLDRIVTVRVTAIDQLMNPMMIDSLQSLATVLFFCGRYGEAETMFRQALSHARVQFEMAYDQPRSLDFFSLVFARSPWGHRVLDHDSSCLCLRVRAWIFQGGQCHDQAMNELEALHDGASLDVYLEMAKIHMRQGNMEKYLECLNKARDTVPSNIFLCKYLLIYASAVDSSCEEKWRSTTQDQGKDTPFDRSPQVIRLASVLKDYGAFKWLRKQYWQAEMYFNEAIDLLALGCDADNLLAAVKLRNEANQLCHRKNHAEAEAKYSAALQHVFRHLQVIAHTQLRLDGLSEFMVGSTRDTRFVSSECANCHRVLRQLKYCSACKHARYCSDKCQHVHWRYHKRLCRLMQWNAEHVLH